MHQSFETKWSDIAKLPSNKVIDETSLYVFPGAEPATQRQLNLYYYFQFIKDILGKINAKDVLEVGCGRGTMSLYLKTHLNLNVAMLDNQPDAIEIAKREFGDIPAQFYVADALHTNLTEGSFDAVISIGLAEHIDDVKSLYGEQYRLLRKGGVMISLNIPKKFSVQYINRAWRLFQKLRGNYKESLKKDYYRNKLQVKDYVSIAKDLGFHDIEVTHVCPFPVYTPMNMTWDKRVAKFNKVILKLKSLFQKYPYKTNPVMAQAHFVVGYK